MMLRTPLNALAQSLARTPVPRPADEPPTYGSWNEMQPLPAFNAPALPPPALLRPPVYRSDAVLAGALTAPQAAHLRSSRTQEPLTDPVLTHDGETINRFEAGAREDVSDNDVLRQAMADEAGTLPICPISLHTFSQPVQVTSQLIGRDVRQNHNFEFADWQTWTLVHGNSPQTRDMYKKPISLVPNFAVQDMCRAAEGLPPLTHRERRDQLAKCHRAARVVSRRTHRTGRSRIARFIPRLVGTGGVAWLGAIIGENASGTTVGEYVGLALGAAAGLLFTSALDSAHQRRVATRTAQVANPV